MRSDISIKLERLKQEYTKQLPSKLKEIENGWQAVSKKHDMREWSNLIRVTHTLCGTAGTYGFTIVSDVARDLEYKLTDLNQKNLNSDNMHAITGLIKDLKQVSMYLPTEVAPTTEYTLSTAPIDKQSTDTNIAFIIVQKKLRTKKILP